MKISIITVCFNANNTIKDTIESVLSQSYINYEYIIVDNCSDDGTLEIIKEYKSKFNGKIKYISKKDDGLYDAMNKGIGMASGDIIGFINADDVIASPNAFQLIIDKFIETSCDGVFSNLLIKDRKLCKVVRSFKGGNGNYKLGWAPPHPTLYLKKNIYDRFGLFTTTYSLASDYDLMVRILKNNVALEYINDTLIYMRVGGKSTAELKNYLISFKESYQILRKNKIHFPLCINFLRTIKVLFQFIFK